MPLVDSITPILDLWAEAEAMYREINGILATEELSAHDWLMVEAVKQQLQQRKGI